MTTQEQDQLLEACRIRKERELTALAYALKLLTAMDAALSILRTARDQLVPKESAWWLVLDSFEDAIGEYIQDARTYTQDNAQ